MTPDTGKYFTLTFVNAAQRRFRIWRLIGCLVVAWLAGLATGNGWAAAGPDHPAQASSASADTSAATPTVQLTPEEEAWRELHPVLQVGVFTGDHLPAEGWSAGRPEGFAVDYARLLASRVGLQLSFHPYSDLDAVLAGSAGGVDPYDLLLAVSVNNEHAARFEFLKPYGGGALFLVARKGDEQIRAERDLAHARIVIERSYHHVIDLLRERFPDATLFFADDGRQAMDMVATGRADAYIGTTASRTQMLLQMRNSDDLVVLAPLDLPPVAVALAVPHGRTMELVLLRKAEAAVSVEEMTRLRSRWGLLSAGEAPTLAPGLSVQERDWLRGLAPLRLGFETDRPPYSFLDSRGHFDGLAADYVTILQKELGFRVQLVPASNWSALQRMVRSGEVDMVAAAMPDDFSSKDMLFSRTYEHFPEVIVARTRGPAIAGPEDLSGHVVAVREEAGLLPRLRMLLPRSHLLPVGSNDEGLEDVASGRADAYIGTLPAIDPLIRDRYAATLRVVGPAGLDQDFTVALASRYERMMPWIDRTLAGITDGQRQAIRSRWLTIQYHYGVPATWVLAGLAATLAIVSLIGFAYSHLRRALRAQRVAESKLDAQLRFQQALLETIPYPVFVKDANGRYVAVNQAYETAFECKRGDLLGRSLLETRHIGGVDAAALHQGDLDVLKHGEDVRRDLKVATAGVGEGARDVLLWLHRFVPSATQEPGLLGTLVDVTDLRETEARALASEQRLIDTNESLPGVVLRVHYTPDGGSSFDYVSGPTEVMFGISHEALLQGRMRPYDVIPDEDRVIVQQAIRDLREKGAVRSVEFRSRTSAGERWLRASFGQPRVDPDDIVTCSIYVTDITLEKEQAEALVEAKATAEAAVAAKSAFLAMMSHEIRTPMAGALSLVELLGRTALDREQRHMLELVHDSSCALLQILDDILDFSRIEAGRMRLEDQAFDLHALIDGALGLFSAVAQAKGVRLYGTLDWRLAAMHRGDMNRVRQIVTNLLSNALKFTAKGYVELHVELMGEIGEGQRLRFTITDTGTGISDEQLEHLFQPFVQAEPSTSRRFGGTGLGLSICRRLAQLMGGEVRLASAAGFGTRAVFEVVLPVAQASRAPTALVGKSALLCTGDIMLERELSNALSALGMSVVGADVRDLADYVDGDIDLCLADEDLVGPGPLPAAGRVIRLTSAADARGVRVEGSLVWLSGYPLTWHSMIEACHSALGLALPEYAASAAPASMRHARRILVAEDHPINRAVIGRQLERLGYPYTMVDNGEEAMRALAGSHYDLLITDCHMPVLDGYALARRIRELEEGGDRHLPIVALSASALPEEVLRCHQAGMDEFLAKPVRLATLEAMLSQCLERAGQAVGAEVGTPGEDDHPGLHVLQDAFGSRSEALRILGGLSTSCRQDLLLFDRAVSSGDQQAQRDVLHRLRGALRLVGIELADEAEPVAQREAIVRQLAWLDTLIVRFEKEEQRDPPST
ncbi:transporter substrate-binding domain-containing protein [Dyella sp. C9]|uniref:ATP-binding protein n=1 Tax=Dyella sp. C9 TaxID=2202154 RepID=UPI0018E57800|nr:transporter substrate-binding domain-containing protein [Dyella sp. C9]